MQEKLLYKILINNLINALFLSISKTLSMSLGLMLKTHVIPTIGAAIPMQELISRRGGGIMVPFTGREEGDTGKGI